MLSNHNSVAIESVSMNDFRTKGAAFGNGFEGKEDIEMTPNGVDDEELLDLDQAGWCDEEAMIDLNICGFLDDHFEEGGGGGTKLSFRKLSISADPEIYEIDCSKDAIAIENTSSCYKTDTSSAPAAVTLPVGSSRSISSRHKRPTILSLLSPAELEEELHQTNFFLTESMRRSELSRRQLNQQVSAGVALFEQESLLKEHAPTLTKSRDKITFYLKEVSSMTLG
jgi:hypothetical protein